MRLRAGRSTLGALVLIAVGLAAYFVFRSEQNIAADHARLRTFDLHAREAADALAELRAAQQAYVATGQSVPFWVAKVATTSDAVRSTVASLRQSASSRFAVAALERSTEQMTTFGDADKRALEYINTGAPMMAGDVIFAEGGLAAAMAARDIESARLAEHQAADASHGAARKLEAMLLGGAAAFAVIVLLVLIPLGDGSESGSFFGLTNDDRREGQDRREGLERRNPLEGLEEGAVLVARSARPVLPAAPPAPSALSVQPTASVASSPDELRRASGQAAVLKTAADLATDFARVRNLHDLKDLLERSADVMDASGLIVWLGSLDGSDLQPIVSHGYSPQAIARMPAVPRAADNAAAAAYRTSTVQVVASRPGGSQGALVAPLLAPEGCIGALAAEIRSGGEGSETVRALATIFAAHLTGIFATVAADAAPEARAANQ